MVKRGIWSYLKETKKVEGPRFKEMVLPGGDEEKSSNIKVSVGRGGKDRFVSNASRLEVMKIKLLAASSKTQNI